MEKLLSRVKNIILSPRSEWQAIKAEQTTTKYIIFSYVAILAIIPAVAAFIGFVTEGYSMKMSLLWAVFSYVSSIVAVVVSAAIINALAPPFESKKDSVKTLKVVSYSYTPAWITGVLNVIPSLDWIVLLGSLYGIYLLYLGLGPLMETPQHKTLGYTVVSIIVLIAVQIVISFLVVGAIPMPA